MNLARRQLVPLAVLRNQWRSISSDRFACIQRSFSKNNCLMGNGSRPLYTSNYCLQDSKLKPMAGQFEPGLDHLSDGEQYARAIEDLNSLQSNNQVLALAKYKKPETILPLFRQQLELAGIRSEDLNRLNVIHVSGTKGKGSTCAFVERILAEFHRPKLKVCSYNSPHLVSVTERIRLNCKPIDKALFSKCFRHVFDKLKRETERANITMPSYFSFLTILAFHIFLEERVDCAVVEVGMGGEYDPTNVIEKPVACAITTLDLDHTNILGKTIEQIAWTKAGIIKPGIPLFTVAHEQPEVIKVIEARAREKQSPVYICKPLDPDQQLELGIAGTAQYLNASLACQLAAYLLAKLPLNEHKFSRLPRSSSVAVGQPVALELETKLETLPDFFRSGLARCQLPGRCQVVRCPGIVFFLDGAHTRKSIENCLEWFVNASMALDGAAKKLLMVNVIGDRDKGEVLKPLSRYGAFERVLFSTNRIQSSSFDELATSETFARQQDPNHEKGLENAKFNAKVWQELKDQFNENNLEESSSSSNKTSTHASIMDCVNLIEKYKLESKPLHVLSTGSLHFVGAVLETLAICYPNEVEV